MSYKTPLNIGCWAWYMSAELLHCGESDGWLSASLDVYAPLPQVCSTVQPYLASFNTGICNVAGDCDHGFNCRAQAGTVSLTCDSTATSLLAALRPTSAKGFCQVSHCPQWLPALGWRM